MIVLLKKYRLNIFVVLVLTGLLLIFIPNEESHYLRPDIEGIRSKSRSVLLWTEVILFAVLFSFGLRQIKKLADIIYLTAGLGLMILTVFFLLDTLFLSFTLFLNRLSKTRTVEKTYNVVYVNSNSKSLLLWDQNLKRGIQADQLIATARNRNIKVTDTVIVSFSKGLIGFNFDPAIKSIRNTAADKSSAASGVGRSSIQADD
jgi:hypothetical protein